VCAFGAERICALPAPLGHRRGSDAGDLCQRRSRANHSRVETVEDEKSIPLERPKELYVAQERIEAAETGAQKPACYGYAHRKIRMSGRDNGKKVRRTRGSASGKRKKAATTGVNGKWFTTIPSAMNELLTLEVTVKVLSTSVDHCAASDDADGTSVAKAATSPAASSARSACAEAADERNVEEAVPRVLSEREELPPGVGEMPEDRAAFAKAVFARVDLVAAWTKQVNSDDEKTVQRAIEKLDEMRYECNSARNEERQQGVEIEVPTRMGLRSTN
jgi:hypothetical protein